MTECRVPFSNCRRLWRIDVLFDGFELPLEVLTGDQVINFNTIGQEPEEQGANRFRLVAVCRLGRP